MSSAAAADASAENGSSKKSSSVLFRRSKKSAAKAKARARKRTADDDAEDVGNVSGVKAEGGAGVKTDTGSAGAGGGVVKTEDGQQPAPGVVPATAAVASSTQLSSDRAAGAAEEDDEEQSTLTKIMNTKKRRKIMTKLTSSRGIDATALLGSGGGDSAALGVGVAGRLGKGKKIKSEKGEHGDSDDDDEAGAAAPSGLQQRLEGTFGTAVGGTDADNDPDGIGGSGVLGKKHRDAMERYINERMGGKADGGGGEGASDTSSKAKSAGGAEDLTEDELYRQIAAEVGAGKVTDDDAVKAAVPQVEKKEDDVGAGGTMLHGTGIAEVALPVDERIRTVRETELATAAKRGMATGRTGGAIGGYGQSANGTGGARPDDIKAILPTSFGKRKKKAGEPEERPAAQQVGPCGVSAATTAPAVPMVAASGRPIVASSAGASVLPTDVSNLGQSYSHNFKMHTHQWVSDRKTEREQEIDKARKEEEAEEGTMENRARVGFEQARKVARGEVVAAAEETASGGAGGRRRDGTGGGRGMRNDWGRGDRNHSSDDRVWRSFVSKQRNRR